MTKRAKENIPFTYANLDPNEDLLTSEYQVHVSYLS